LPAAAVFGKAATAATVAAALTANVEGGADMNTTAVGSGGPVAGPLSDPPQPDVKTARNT
jgi:hypothetical protein